MTWQLGKQITYNWQNVGDQQALKPNLGYRLDIYLARALTLTESDNLYGAYVQGIGVPIGDLTVKWAYYNSAGTPYLQIDFLTSPNVNKTVAQIKADNMAHPLLSGVGINSIVAKEQVSSGNGEVPEPSSFIVILAAIIVLVVAVAILGGVK